MKNCPKKIKTAFKFKFDIYKLSFKVSIAALLISVFAQMIFTNKLAVKSGELVELEKRKDVLEKEISALEFEDSRVSSLSYLENAASAAGFVKMNDNILAIKDPTTAAVLNKR